MSPCPPVTFAGTPLPTGWRPRPTLNDGYSIITRFRLTSVTSETGGVTSVSLRHAAVVVHVGELPGPDQNTTLCYPDLLDAAGREPARSRTGSTSTSSPAVTETEHGGGDQPVTDNYTYSGAGLALRRRHADPLRPADLGPVARVPDRSPPRPATPPRDPVTKTTTPTSRA